jgi:hypothetical protein
VEKGFASEGRRRGSPTGNEAHTNALVVVLDWLRAIPRRLGSAALRLTDDRAMGTI